MKNFNRSLIVLALVLAITGLAFGQSTAYSTTTLTTALTATASNSRGGNCITVGSTTGMYGPGVPISQGGIGTPTTPAAVSLIMIDGELMRINSVPDTTHVCVERGSQGSRKMAHDATSTVYFGPASQFPNPDIYSGAYFIGPAACTSATTGTQGTGDNTIIVDGSVPALKSSATNAAANVHTFTCAFQLPVTRLSKGSSITLTDITYLYSVQTTTATSMTASTFKYFAAPQSAASETASSATLVDACNTCVQLPVTGSANLTAVSAGQYYTQRVSLGTPLAITNSLKTYVFTFVISQSASAAMIVTTPGLWVHLVPNLL